MQRIAPHPAMTRKRLPLRNLIEFCHGILGQNVPFGPFILPGQFQPQSVIVFVFPLERLILFHIFVIRLKVYCPSPEVSVYENPISTKEKFLCASGD